MIKSNLIQIKKKVLVSFFILLLSNNLIAEDLGITNFYNSEDLNIGSSFYNSEDLNIGSSFYNSEDIKINNKDYSINNDCYYCNSYEPYSWENDGIYKYEWYEWQYYWSTPAYFYYPLYSYSIPSYSVNSNYYVPNYNLNTKYSVPNVNLPNVNINIPEFKVPNVNLGNINLNIKPTEIKAIDTVANYTVNTGGVGYYPNEAIEVGNKFVNNAIKKGETTYNNWVINAKNNYDFASQNGNVTKEWLIKNGKHIPLTKVALTNGNYGFTMQGACTEGCAPGTGGYFVWGVNPNNLTGKTDLVSAGGNINNNFSSKLTGLKQGVKYYYRAVIKDRNGKIKYGELMSYTVPYTNTIIKKTSNNNSNKSSPINSLQNVKINAVIENGIIYVGGKKIGTCNNCDLNQVNQALYEKWLQAQNIVINQNGNTINSNISNSEHNNVINNASTTTVNTNATSTSFWSGIKKMFTNDNTSTSNTNLNSANANAKTNVSTTTSGYSWYEWVLLFVFILIFVGALRYLWNAFFKSTEMY